MSNTTVAKHSAESKPSVIKKIFNVLFYTIIAIVIIFALLMTIMSLGSKDGLSEIFGHYIMTVQSESMTGTFEKGDIIICKKVDASTLEKDDIISFYYIVQDQRIVVTHRIVEVKTNEIGVKYFITQGDAKENIMHEEVFIGDVIAKYTGTKISGAAKVAEFIKSKNGFLVCVVIPLFLFLFWQLYSFIKTLIDIKQVNYQDEVNNQAKALAAEMLKQMQEQNLVANPPTAQPVETTDTADASVEIPEND